jgi:hypothetical protein
MYLCVGMVVFVALEERTTSNSIQHKKKMQEHLKTDIQNKFNMSDVEFTEFVGRSVEAYSSMPTEWTYLNSFAFVFQTITTIGKFFFSSNRYTYKYKQLYNVLKCCSQCYM